ncbi:MAG: radical SAM protein [Nitrospirae bacterium]|nr:radical SAM protein [Nitrospirota bacterium]
MLLVYPNSYFVGMSNLGFQAIYYQLNQRPDTYCQRLFLDSSPLVSLEKGWPVNNFDIIAFSIPFELDYLNILKILDLAAIPLKGAERSDGYPLIIAGGIAVSANPEPLSEFIDLFVLGEGEEVVHELIDAYKAVRSQLSSPKHRQAGRTGREEALKKLAEVEGIYVPRFYHVSYNENGTVKAIETEDAPGKVRRRWVKDIDRYRTASHILTKGTEFGDMYLIEISRGCSENCYFCLAGYAYRPWRVRSLEKVFQEIEEGRKHRERIGFISTLASRHPQIEKICSKVLETKGKVSLASLRPGTLSKTLIEAMDRSGQRTLTLAPETGKEALRRTLNKNVSDEEILKSVELVADFTVPNLRLYFIIGLPGEDDDDIVAIADLVGKIRKRLFVSKKPGKITVSVNPFVPKASTSFQGMRMEEGKTLSRRLKILKKELRNLKNINFIHESVKWSLWQGILSRGDRRLGNVLLSTYRWEGDWRRALREEGLDESFYLRRGRSAEEIFPWAHLD